MDKLALAVALALSSLNAGPCWAQTSQPAAVPSDLKKFGDWTVRCFPNNGNVGCDMYQQMNRKDTQQRVLGISIAYRPAEKLDVILIALPLGVSVQKGVQIKTSVRTSERLPYGWCDHNGCYVETPLSAELLSSLGTSGPNADVLLATDDGKGVDLHFSLSGFWDAHQAMIALLQQKTPSTRK